MTKMTLLAAAAACALAAPAAAQDKYIGEVFLVGFNFCPRGSTTAAGQLLPIASNQALFSLLGTIYGGDGRTTFALPDLRGRAPVAEGQGNGLSNVQLGEAGGAETTTLSVDQLPSHRHPVLAQLNGVTTPGSSPSPAGNMPALSTTGSIYGNGAPVQMAGAAVSASGGPVGGGQPVPTRSPYLGMTWCVTLQGIFPSRS